MGARSKKKKTAVRVGKERNSFSSSAEEEKFGKDGAGICFGPVMWALGREQN